MASWRSIAVVAALWTTATAQFPPPRQDITWVKSPHHPGISISYKKPNICETTPGVKSYSGYIHLPPNSINETGESQDYPINTFFWFFEARKDPHKAPLSIWLNGGPGASSLAGLFQENGPCFVNADSNSTVLNPWSWNNEVNILYIDQPVQVGFSYDTLNNGTMNLNLKNSTEESGFDDDDGEEQDSGVVLDNFADGKIPEQNATFFVGTFPSQRNTSTANSTAHAAVAMWHFAQTWFEEFPEYKPKDERVSLWAESYGGHYGPAFMDFFSRQNDKISKGLISGPGVHYIKLDTLGLVNACIDDVVQTESYTTMAWNNTYGLFAVNETTHHGQMYDLSRPGGVLDQLEDCQKLARDVEAGVKDVDPAFVEDVCRNASGYAARRTVGPYVATKKFGWFDITHPLSDPFPSPYLAGYLKQHWVQKALGVPINHTTYSDAVSNSFTKSGDMARGGFLEDLEHLLDNGIKVAMMYGDRDFACNWIGGEQASLAIKHKYASDFAKAGYEAMVVNDQAPFVPFGLTRQHGNLSFTRVFQAGHMVPSYQPEASLRIFERSLFNRDIATGTVDIAEGDKTYSSKGPSDTWWRKNEVMPAPKPECYSLARESCSAEQVEALNNGTAIIRDWIVVGIEQPKKEEVELPAGQEAMVPMVEL